ncbi:MAG: M50 family metallopeptidase [Dehalococcoidia bacterium]|nr:M50 family metallopeptidase [Dehalococcoidia bacterium]
MTVIIVITLLSLLIMAHELGHLITAKLAGVKVEEFGMGFPPRLAAFRWGETEYSINLLFFGGFVRLLGEDEATGPRSLAGKSKKVRLMVLSSGALVNIVLPLFLFTGSFLLPREVAVGDVTIMEVAPASPAERVGLLPGDRVVEVEGRKVNNHLDLTYQIQLNLGRPMDLVIERDSSLRQFTLTPRWRPPSSEGSVGVLITTGDTHVEQVSYSPLQAMSRGVRTLADTFQLLRNEIISWIVGRTSPQVGGPVAIVQIGGEMARAGPGPLLAFTGFISINLAIINILPLPGLDGGRLFFLGLEAVRRGRRVSPQKERLVHFFGFVTLLALLLLVSYYDLMRMLGGESLP